MGAAVRFIAVLVLGLALLTWLTFSLAVRTTLAWFERDLTLRSSLAVSAAHEPLADAWQRGDLRQLQSILGDMAQDERVLGVRACDVQAREVATVGQYPEAPSTSCAAMAFPPSVAGAFGQLVQTRGGRVHMTSVPVDGAKFPLGTISFAHDLSFIDRRRTQIRALIVTAFAVLALGASLLTLVITRLSWQGWNRELREAMLGGEARPRYAPLLEDVRALAQRIADERAADREAGPWGPERLRRTLRDHLHGERVTIVANREPYIHQHEADGSVRVLHPASGLVTALEPVMEACSGVWVAHGSGSADRETADHEGRLPVPPGEGSYTLQRVWLTKEEERGYYFGFANEGLWPLCHVAHIRPVFRGGDFAHYQTVNERFAQAAMRAGERRDPVVLVQDYHFGLVPAMILRRRPRATVLTFWHIPWPSAERFGICPWRTQLLQGLLGSSILGFHTQLHCNNFIEAVDRFLEARIDRERFAVVHGGHTTLVRPYPISIEWPNRWALGAPAASTCRAEIIAEHGLAPDALIGIGVDRLDYTKGIEERLLAVERLLEKHTQFVDRFVFLQIAAPSRSAIDAYRDLGNRVERHATRINQRFGLGKYRPIVLLRAHHEPDDVFRHYRAANVCYVSSLHDGMNLVAKEFVAARDDEQGVLVLSSFTGASRELTEALIVNPYDIEEAADALAAALMMAPEEQRVRMQAMRALVAHFNVYRWAGRMLIDAALLRDRERRSDRFAAWPAAPPATS